MKSLVIAAIVSLKVTVLCVLFLWPSSAGGWSLGELLMSPVELLTQVLDRWNIELAWGTFWVGAMACQFLAYFAATISVRYVLRLAIPASS